MEDINKLEQEFIKKDIPYIRKDVTKENSCRFGFIMSVKEFKEFKELKAKNKNQLLKY